LRIRLASEVQEQVPQVPALLRDLFEDEGGHVKDRLYFFRSKIVNVTVSCELSVNVRGPVPPAARRATRGAQS
jgi:hypothetical protein